MPTSKFDLIILPFGLCLLSLATSKIIHFTLLFCGLSATPATGKECLLQVRQKGLFICSISLPCLPHLHNKVLLIASAADMAIYTLHCIAVQFFYYFSQSMARYLSREELNQLLENPWFTQFYSSNVHHYAYYRGKLNATVLTLRYNLGSNQFTEDAMIESVLSTTLQQFSNKRQVIGLIEFDLLLVQPDSNSFYIWRANSNVIRNLPTVEQTITLSYDALYLFIRNAAHTNPTDLNVYFSSSSVVISQIIAIVFTFISF